MAFMSILARLGLDSSGFQAGVKEAESAAKGLGKSISSELKGQLAKAFSVTAVVTAGKAVMDYADKIGNMSDRLGLSTDELQRFDYAARQSGSSLETFQGVFEKLSVAREEALEGNEQMVESFARLGVSMDDLKNRRLDELIKIIGRTVQAGDAQALLPALHDVGGKGAGELIPTFQAGLDETGSQAPIISAEDIEAMKQAGDSFSALTQTLQADFAPAVVMVVDAMQYLVDLFRTMAAINWSSFKFFSRFAGALSGGASFKEAAKEGATAFDDVNKTIDQYDDRQRRQAAAEEARRLKNEEAKQRKAEEDNIAGLREAKKAADAQFKEDASEANRQAAEKAAQDLKTAEAARKPVAGAEEAQKKAEAKMQALRDRVQDKEDRALPEAERRLKLEEKIAKLREKAEAAAAKFKAEETPANEKAALEAKANLLDAEAQLKPEKPEKEVAATFKVADPLVNSLERIGFSFGKAMQPAGQNELKQIAVHTKETAKFTAMTAKNTGVTSEAFK